MNKKKYKKTVEYIVCLYMCNTQDTQTHTHTHTTHTHTHTQHTHTHTHTHTIKNSIFLFVSNLYCNINFKTHKNTYINKYLVSTLFVFSFNFIKSDPFLRNFTCVVTRNAG
jgi:hypothetical protein